MTAVKSTGLGDNAYVGGYNLSSDTQQLGRIGGGPAALDVTAIDKSGHERLGGLRDGAIQWVSYFDDQTGQAHAALSGIPTTDVIVSYFRGTVIGNAAASCVAKQVGYDPTRDAAGNLTFAVSATSNAYGLEWGQQLTAGVRTDTTATNGSSLDGGAATTYGLQAYLHVFAITGTSVTVTLQDSADNSNWTGISGAAFTAASAIGAQRIAVTGTVRRYVRAITSGTFSSASFAVNFVRNEITVAF